MRHLISDPHDRPLYVLLRDDGTLRVYVGRYVKATLTPTEQARLIDYMYLAHAGENRAPAM